MERKPIAVLISDVHYSLPTLELADKAMNMAIDKAKELGLPLIVAGDLHDTKANLRAECVNAMLKTFSKYHNIYVIIGNHDKINEKSDKHALDFLSYNVRLITSPRQIHNTELFLIPYYSDIEELKSLLTALPIDFIHIMHQGLQGSISGDYFMDKTALCPSDVAGRRIISGHYHSRQDIKLPNGGLWSYIGNPYTLNFGEAKDPEKGFQILYSDGSLEFIPTNLRSHCILDWDLTNDDYTMKFYPNTEWNPEKDIILIKMKGTKERLAEWSKDRICRRMGWNSQSFRLDLVTLETTSDTVNHSDGNDLLDSLIDSKDLSDTMKVTLKDLWRRLESN